MRAGSSARPKGRILSGMRPTGLLHLGHEAGVLVNWLALQESYETFFEVADWHVLTTAFEGSAAIERNTRDMVLDWLACGIDPEKSVLFRQSDVKAHAELHLIFSMLVTVPRLERNPAVKEQAKALHLEERISYGHLGYPVLQAADILIYRANVVPVGEDQVPHLELTREIARRFNQTYGDVFPEPEAKLTAFARLPGPDGNRMSKSQGNAIHLSSTAEEVGGLLRKAVTDPRKVRKGDPGRPEVCLVYDYHRLYNPGETEEIAAGCRSGALGCVDCKKRATARLNEHLDPIRAKRAELESRPSLVDDVLAEGGERAREETGRTMERVYEAMRFGGTAP